MKNDIKYYIDTSLLAAYYCPEELSDRVQAFLAKQVKPAISYLTEVELSSAVSRKVRMGELSQADGTRILSKFQSHIESDIFTIYPLEKLHWRIAAGWLRLCNTSLRTLDALHLALAFENELILATSDRHLINAANTLEISFKSFLEVEK